MQHDKTESNTKPFVYSCFKAVLKFYGIAIKTDIWIR
jgi:hypothetical protein